MDTEGNVLLVLVSSAAWPDEDGGLWLLGEAATELPRVQKVWADGGYRGDWQDLVADLWNIEVEVVTRSADQRGFVVLPRRWVVERTLAWISRNRRLAKDYERLPAVAEAWIYLASIHRQLKLLRPDSSVPRPYQRRSA